MATDQAPLLVPNLLLDVAGVASLLRREMERGMWLNAYLLGAGMNQAVEDYLHRDVCGLRRMRGALVRLPVPFGIVAAAGADLSGALGLRLRACRAGERWALRWQMDLAALVQRLADRLADDGDGAAQEGPVGGGEAADPLDDGALLAAAEALMVPLSRLPAALRRSIQQLPTCFRSLDQHPADCRAIVARFSARWPDRAIPLLVVGLRTSGCYLAPLYAAFLKRAGCAYVETMTLRPRQYLLAADRRTIARLARLGGLALLADDPPRSGVALTRAAGKLRALGVPQRAIVLLLPLAVSSPDLPARLAPYQAITLPWRQWAVHARLAPVAVRQALTDMLGGRTIRAVGPDGVPTPVRVRAVGAVERLELAPLTDLKAGSPVRRHVRALFRAALVDDDSGQVVPHDVYVKGTGLGYFGDHSLAVAGPLGDFFPAVYGLRDGLLYRAWLPEENRLPLPDAVSAPRIAERIASYVLARRRALAVEEDVAARLGGRSPVWERIADLIGEAFAGSRPLRPLALARPLFHNAVRQLLRVDRPSVIDGSMALAQWFERGDDETLVKVDFDERAFSNQDTVVDELYCYDAAYDLAAAAADYEVERPDDGRASGFPERLRRAYEAAAGPGIGEERWLLYQWLALMSYRQLIRATLAQELAIGDGQRSPPAALVRRLSATQRALARVHQRYYARRLLDGVRPSPSGPLCALDIDGVLERGRLGFTATTPAGALALRALTLHGYRPVLATGRSLGEVRERCAAFGLAGGVAEYGAAVYDHTSEAARILLSADDREALERLRQKLPAIGGVYLDPDYRYAVRAYRLDARAERRGLTPAIVSAALGGADRRLRAIPGSAQTDFMVAGVDKGTGLAALVDALCPEPAGASPLALAVGDTGSDLPMFGLAGLSFAPANADASVRLAGVPIMQRRYQPGLALAVGRLLGHPPGGCPVCRAPELPADARLLLALLAAQDSGVLGKWKIVIRRRHWPGDRPPSERIATNR